MFEPATSYYPTARMSLGDARKSTWLCSFCSNSQPNHKVRPPAHYRFTLSFRDVEDLLAQRGITVS